MHRLVSMAFFLSNYQNEYAEISRIFDVRFSSVEERMYLEQLGNQGKSQLTMTKAQAFKGGLKEMFKLF